MLRDVSFRIEPGETVAVVGHTGAGKTTMISLLLRFYDVQQGAIRIGGVDIRRCGSVGTAAAISAWCCRIHTCLRERIEDNIRLGTESIEQEDMEEAAEQVNLMDFIRSLPEGLEQPIRERGNGAIHGAEAAHQFCARAGASIRGS